MRTITDHIVGGDTAPQLSIQATDAPGAGGANHRYEITWPGGVTLDADGHNQIGTVNCVISFQNGPIKDHGINGLTQEVLLAIVIDRLRSFQAGPFACVDNQEALWDAGDALYHLQSRTRDRIRRGVEGQSVK
jgi:hypothetical protein